MAGPWEKYAQPDIQTSGPWAKYAAAAVDQSSPSVPFYVGNGNGEMNVNASPEIRANFDVAQAAQDRSASDEQAAFDATRMPMTRLRDTATMAASVPVRALTQGEHGIGDVFGLVNENAGKNASQSEADFARANAWGLEKAAAIGETLVGVPMLSTMGAVPGQMIRTGTAAVRQLPREIKALAREDVGAVKIPGAPVPTVAPGAAPQPNALLAGVPNREQTFAAAERLKALQTPDGPINIDLPEMVVGNQYKQSLAAGLRSIPLAGEPIEMGYQKGLQQLSGAKQAAGASLGVPEGAEAAGGAIKQSGLNWIRKNSKDYLKEKYDEVASSVDQGVTRQLSATADTVRQLQKEMQVSTVKTSAPAIQMVSEALARPEGLSAKGVSELRTAVGRQIDAARTVPDPAEAAYKRLYTSLDKDLQVTLKQAGGDQALRAWQVANREAKVVSGKRKRLAQVIGSDEGKLSDEMVFKKIQTIATENTSNLRNLRTIKEIVGDRDWGNMSSELINRMGIDPKTGDFSGDRLLSEYGKYSSEGKYLLFGAAKQHLDDIATIARKFGQLSGRFNRSNTGVVNAVLKFINSPTTIAVHAASALTNPVTAATFGTQGAALAAGRSLAWSLARPTHAARVTNVLKAYAKVARTAHAGVEIAAKSEENLARAIRIYAQGVAVESGLNANDIASGLQRAINEARNNNPQD